ncbi:MAG TPA: hypothetical protein VKO63_06070, partial [Chitinispirillaceae bacterium]|nr:hypothetical protein [Chitinispirillaceae bacterium]
VKCSIIFAAETFVSQFYVDSLIDNAVFKFYSRFDPSSGITHEDAIKYAKGITYKLRETAAKDANKKYILAKVNELEQQIYLEENELTMEKAQWSQKKSNELIAEFNSGLAKERPDFEKLYKIKSRLIGIEPKKCVEVETSFKNRAVSFGKVIPSVIDQLLGSGNTIDAQMELAYCVQNASYIKISAADLARLEAKVLSKSIASYTVKLVKDSFDSLKMYLGNMDFKTAHWIENSTSVQIHFLKKELTSSEWERYNSDMQVLSRKINAKEDSLIAIAERLVRVDRIVDAGAMLDTLKKIGVNSDKLAVVNKVLLHSLITQQKNLKETNIYALDVDTGATKPVLADLVLAAKSKALADRENSIRLRNEKNALTQTAEVKKERAAMSLEMQKKRADARRNSELQKAYDKMVEIFSLIEKDNLDDAQKSYASARNVLVENVASDDILKMESVLGLSKSAGK